MWDDTRKVLPRTLMPAPYVEWIGGKNRGLFMAANRSANFRKLGQKPRTILVQIVLALSFAAAAHAQPTFGKVFAPDTIGPGSVSTLPGHHHQRQWDSGNRPGVYRHFAGGSDPCHSGECHDQLCHGKYRSCRWRLHYYFHEWQSRSHQWLYGYGQCHRYECYGRDVHEHVRRPDLQRWQQWDRL